MSIRETLAQAVSRLDRYNISAYYRQTTKAGDGFVSFAGTTPSENGFGWMDSWQILIVLGGDLKAAEIRLDEDLAQILEALEPYLVLTQVTPSQIAFDTLVVSALVIEGVTARD